MSSEQWMIQLSHKLNGTLPGELAHGKMKARRLDNSAIQFPKAKNPRQSAVLIMLYELEGRMHFPLIKRSDYEGVHSGQISLPGGKMELTDRDLVETALRETEEEIGIKSSEISVLGQLSSFYVGASNFQVQPIVGYAKGDLSFRTDKVEVAQLVQTSLDEFSAKTRKEMTMNVSGYDIIAPYFDLQGHVVWGATAMILNEFRTIVEEI